MVPGSGWAPKGTRAGGSVPTGHRRHHPLIAPVTPTGMGPSLLIQGSIDRAAFDTFLEQVLVPSLQPGQIVIMDNASIPKGADTRALLEAAGIELWFLPPSSPEFNPIESAFAKLKHELRKARPRSPETLETAIKAGLDAITQRDIAGFYRGAGYVLPS